MTDDIYEHIRFDGTEPVCPVAIEPGSSERTLLVNGVSKTYAMTGFRIGYGAGPRWADRRHEHHAVAVESCVCSLGQAAAVAALNGDQGFVAEGARRLSRAPRPDGRVAQRHSGHELPFAGRRLLRLSVLLRVDRQAHARGEAFSKGTSTS